MLSHAIADAFKSTIVRISSSWLADTQVGTAPTIVVTPGEEIPGARLKATPVVARSAAIRALPVPAIERAVTLRDGALLRLRAVRPDDEPRLEALFERLSPRTVYLRFFAAHRRLPPAWYHDFANVDYIRRFALVAEDVGVGGVRLRGVARWEPAEEPGALEIALVVEDAWQGRGLGDALFSLLLEAAAAHGHDRFCADVLAENDRMLRMLRTRTQMDVTSAADGVIHVCFSPRTEAALGSADVA